MKSKVDLEKLKFDALEGFQKGYACSGTVVYALNKYFGFGLSEDAIAMSAGFPLGLGGGGCICGAVAGSTMGLGFVFGKKREDASIIRCYGLTNEFHDKFKEKFGATCCGVLLDRFGGLAKFDRGDAKRQEYCINLVAFALETTAEIIARETLEREK